MATAHVEQRGDRRVFLPKASPPTSKPSPATPEKAASPRLKELDVLRGIAVFLVLLRHLPGDPDQLHGPLGDIVHVGHKIGWAGVDLFFVLSGFLISGLLFSEHIRYGRIDRIRFYIRRGFKIYPGYYIFLIVQTATLVALGYAVPARPVFGEAVFLQNYLGGFYQHTWSLAIEEHFYLMLPLLLTFVCDRKSERNRDPFRLLVPLFLGIAAGVLILRLFTPLAIDDPRAMFRTHLRLDALLFGVLLSYLFHFHRAALNAFVTAHRLVLGILSLGLISTTLIFPVDHIFMQTFGFTCVYLGFGGFLLLSLQNGPLRRLIDSRPLSLFATIGFYSYSIYLWHLAARSAIGKASPLLLGDSVSPGVILCLYLVGSILIGIAAAKVIEIPFLKMRDRFYPSRSTNGRLVGV
jgi:peptidoglycan/LPS O-acetylase OafA/YrhL